MVAVRRNRFRLVHSSCRRCGAPILTGNRSLYGAESTRQKYGRICGACVTDDERREMDAAWQKEVFGR